MHKLLEEQLEEFKLTREAHTNPRLRKFIKAVDEVYQTSAPDREEEIFKALIEAVPGYVSWISDDLKYLGVNQKLANAFHLKPWDFIGRPIDFLGNAGPFLTFASSFIFSKREHDSWICPMEFGQSNEPRWYLLQGQKYNDNKNAIIVSVDITDVKEAQEKIADQEEKLNAISKMAALGQVAAGIAHEINNPLAVLQVTNEMLERSVENDTVDTERVVKSVERINAMTTRISNIVKGCRNFSREGSNDPFETHNLKSIIEDTLELARGRYLSNKVTLNIGQVDEKLFIDCRPGQISQVILNILNNAVDAVEGLKKPWVKLAVENKDDKLSIVITDSGDGISEDIVEKLFDPFYTTKKPGKGTGLGLNICRGIVKEHRGDIYVDHENPNTSFVIELPLSKEQKSN